MLDKNKLIAFTRLLVGVWQYYGKPVPDIERYWHGLKHYPLANIAHALDVHLADPDVGQFPPRIAHLMRILEGSKATRAMTAWAKVRLAIEQVGGYDSVIFDDPGIHAVITDLGGWGTLCRQSIRELTFSQNTFQQRYQHYLDHPPAAYPSVLPGYLAKLHCRDGDPPPAPIRIGQTPQNKQGITSNGKALLPMQPDARALVPLNPRNSDD